MCKFRIGDKVKIVKYGHLFWQNKSFPQPELPFPIIQESGNIIWRDMSPEEVGKVGVVKGITKTSPNPKYSLDKEGKNAWFNEDQLELT